MLKSFYQSLIWQILPHRLLCKHILNLGNIEAVVFDFDGVFSDNRVYTDQDGREMVCCNRSDGIGLKRLRDLGLAHCVISKERNEAVAKRCEKLGIDAFTGIDNKMETLRNWLAEHDISADQTIFVGNDTPDLDCMKLVKYGFCPSDAHEDVLQSANFIIPSRGGDAFVRKICDLVADHLEIRRKETL